MNNKVFVTDECTLLYPNLLQPREDLSGKLRYSVVPVFGDDEAAAIIAHCREAYSENISTFTDKDGVITPFEAIALPLHDGTNEKPGKSEYEGKLYMNVRSDFCPDVIDSFKRDITDPRLLRSGMTGRVAYRLFCYCHQGSPGISAALVAVQKTGDKPRSSAAALFPDGPGMSDLYEEDCPF